jgi:hypothetical protein
MANYGSTAGTQAIVPTLGTFGASSVPTSSQVSIWLEEGGARINRALATAGYVVPVASGAVVYAELTALNNLYAAAYAIRARGLDTGTGEDESRDVIWLREFDQRLADLVASDLSALGVTPVTARPRRRLRTIQARRIDGYSGRHEGSTIAPDYVSD